MQKKRKIKRVLEQGQYCFEIDSGNLKHVICKVSNGALWVNVIITYVHTGRENVGLCLCTSLIYDVYDCVESMEMVE